MLRTIYGRRAALALLVLLATTSLLPPSAMAAPHAASAGHHPLAAVSSSSHFDLLASLHRAWGWITGLWADSMGIDAGGMIDPNGGKWGSNNPTTGPIG